MSTMAEISGISAEIVEQSVGMEKTLLIVVSLYSSNLVK